METYVCSDIHGHFDEWLEALIKSGLNLSYGDNLIILGDLIDRGPESLECVKFAIEMVDKYPGQVTYIIGNHEKMMLDFVLHPQESPDDSLNIAMNGQSWLSNGGSETVRSFLKIKTAPTSYFELQRLLNAKHSGLFKRLSELPYYKVDEKNGYVFVHAGFRSNVRLTEQSQEDMLWIREEFMDDFSPVSDDILVGKTIIHGHTPVQYLSGYEGKGFFQGRHHICIDGGAARMEKILIIKVDDLSVTEEHIQVAKETIQ